jgi:cyclopropane-fatty-acyl-phospholipid synthase
MPGARKNAANAEIVGGKLASETPKTSGESSARGGASKSAIQAHYDVGNDFYRLWLDRSMTYSCAIWGKHDEELETAQDRKIEYHIVGASAIGCQSVLEIGCGWGSCLRKLVEEHDVQRAVGLTLSEAQRNWIDAMNLGRVETRVENWADHVPAGPYDAIISLAAIAHFVRPDLNRDDRVAVYRDFFSKCYEWLKPQGKLSIETQIYGKGAYISESPLSEIFPESDMPHFPELVEGFDGIFEVENIVNHRQHYPRTLKCWISGLEKNRDLISEIAGSTVFEKYRKFLHAGVRGHESGVFGLVRLNLSKSW